MDARIPSGHPLINWLVEHASGMYNRNVVGDDRRTLYQVMHGQRFKGKVVEFGEQVFCLAPTNLVGPQVASGHLSREYHLLQRR